MRQTYRRNEAGTLEFVDLVSTNELINLQHKARFWQALCIVGLAGYAFLFSVLSDVRDSDRQRLTQLMSSISACDDLMKVGESRHENQD